jgi:AcrR family transcriptional regulator
MKHHDLDSRDKILRATTELLWEYGIQATTTKLIAEKAGVNSVTIFRIFKNKESLFLEVIGRVVSIELEKLRDLLKKDFSSLDSFFFQLNAAFSETLVAAEKTFSELMKETMDSNSAFFAEVSQGTYQWVSMIAAKFEELSRQGLLRKVDFMDLSLLYTNIFLGAPMLRKCSDVFSGKSSQRSIEDMTQILIEGLRP